MPDQALFEEFKELKSKGLKKEARKRIRAFLDSFDDDFDRDKWSEQFLENLGFDAWINASPRPIPGEIVLELLVPYIQKLYARKTWRGYLWTGVFKYWIRDPELYAEDHIHIAYTMAPDEPLPRAYLRFQLAQKFDYAFHEWPHGVLIYSINDDAAERDFKLMRTLCDTDNLGDSLDEYREIMKEARRIGAPSGGT